MIRLREYIRRRIPRVPNWRWILFHVLTDKPCQFDTSEFKKLKRFVEENVEDPLRVIGIDVLVSHGIEPIKEIDEAILVRNQPPICKTVQSLLLENCPIEEISNIIGYKFNEQYEVKSIEYFRDFFWDTVNLNSYDFAKYYQESGGRPKPPPTAGKFRTAYKIFKEGGDPEIDLDEAMEYAYIRTFFRAEELFKEGNDTMALRAQRVALDVFKALKDSRAKQNRVSAAEFPENFDIQIVYPSETCANITSVNYNPDEDDGAIEDNEQ